jgi:hypothetical protein
MQRLEHYSRLSTTASCAQKVKHAGYSLALREKVIPVCRSSTTASCAQKVKHAGYSLALREKVIPFCRSSTTASCAQKVKHAGYSLALREKVLAVCRSSTTASCVQGLNLMQVLQPRFLCLGKLCLHVNTHTSCKLQTCRLRRNERE